MAHLNSITSNRPRALIIAPYAFIPPAGGGKMLIYNNARILSRYYDLEFLLPTPAPGFYLQGLENLKRMGKVHTIDLSSRQLGKGPDSFTYILKNYPRAILAKYPIIDIYNFYENPKTQALIRDNFSFIQLNHSMWYHAALKQRQAKLVLIQHNCEYEYWREMAAALYSQQYFFKAFCYSAGSDKIFRQEREAMNDADLVLALSQKEKEIFAQIYRRTKNCFAINPGIDLKPYQSWINFSDPNRDPDEIRLIYVGSLDTPQNAAGAIHFTQKLYPQLKKIDSFKFKLFLIGANPTPKLTRLAADDPTITLTGYVKDVAPWIAKADIYIVPLSHGTGIRFKIMEAMAMGKPIVSTAKGAEGLKLPETGLIITEQFTGFIESILELARKPDLRKGWGKENATYAAAHFDCEKIFQARLLPLYQNIITSQGQNLSVVTPPEK